jgi:putative ABC transport system permease protein
MLINALIQALEEIKRNIFRSLLTALGIIIGIASVVAMVNIGQSASKTITGSISKLGSNNLFIIPGQIKGPGGRTHNAPLFDLKDVSILKKSIYTIDAISPLEAVSVLSIYKNRNYSTMLRGINNDFFKIKDYHLKNGEFFNKSDLSAGKNKCIIGETVYDKLFVDKNAIGKIINLNKFSCEIVGVLKAKGADTFGRDQDDVIFAPIKFVQRRFTGSNKINLMVASVKEKIPLKLAKAQIAKILRQIRNIKKGDEDNFSIRDLTALLNTLKKITSTLTLMLGAVAAISLIVGGIGIMNIMLVSVTERTREIGVRMAVGATKNDILSQFLIESAVLSSIGGIIGIILGVTISYFVEKFMHLDFVFNIEIMIIATLFSIFIGVVFGFIPARKAANLNPIDALRYE